MRHREIWLGDVARAATALGASDPSAWKRIAALLGLGPGNVPAPASEPSLDAVAVHSPAPLPRPDAPQGTGRPVPKPSPNGTPRHPPSTTANTPLTPTEHRTPRRTGWTVESLPSPRTTTGRVRLHVPLLAPRSTAAVLHAALARVAHDGDLDVERAADHLARGLPLQEIPRRPLPTLRYGVQILADISASMEPFAQDVEGVIDQVRSLVGVARTTVLRFADCPSRGVGTGPRGTWGPYRPPQPGTRILLLSALGIIGPPFDPHRATEREWREILLRIRQHGCEAVALVPQPERLWPTWWRSQLHAVVWDRGTTVGRVVGELR